MKNVSLCKKVSPKDQLPEKMCLTCISEMNLAFAFKQKCARSEKTLRAYLEQTCEQQEKTAQSSNIITISLNVSDAKVETNNSDQPSDVIEIPIDDMTVCHDDVCECSNCKSEAETTLLNEYVDNEEQSIDYQYSDNIEYIQAEEQIESTLVKLDVKKTAVENMVKDFIAENTMKFICSHCKASFTSRRSLNLHVNGRKCMQLSYECDICHKIFVKKRYLVRHLQRMHRMSEADCADEAKMDNRKKYKCHSCPKGKNFYLIIHNLQS